MSGVLAELLGLSRFWILTGGLVFLRVGAAFLVLPAISEQFIPMRIRLGAALAMALLLTPMIGPDLLRPEAEMSSLSRFWMTEPLAGLLLGLSVRFVAQALQIAGTMAAQATSLSQIAGGVTPEPQPAISGLLFLSGLALAVMMGLHLHVARMLALSYDVLPAGQLPLAGDLGSWGVARVGAAFALAFSLAAPFVIASLLYNLALGVINKAMPQLMVAFVGAPAITWAGLFLLFLSVPLILPVWMRAMMQVLVIPMGGAG